MGPEGTLSSDTPVTLTPKEFELFVLDELARIGSSLSDVRVTHREKLPGPDGIYEIDVVVRFEALGVSFLVLAECKHQRRSVEREQVQVLRDRLTALGAQKAILFATCPFQAGATWYASQHNIALVHVSDTRLSYIQKGAAGAPELQEGDRPYRADVATIDDVPSAPDELAGVTYSSLSHYGLTLLLRCWGHKAGV